MGIILRLENSHNMLEIDMVKDYSQRIWVCFGMIFEGYGVQSTINFLKILDPGSDHFILPVWSVLIVIRFGLGYLSYAVCFKCHLSIFLFFRNTL